MTDTETIPEDISQTAEKIAWDVFGWSSPHVARKVALAILAERSRCAEVAYTYGQNHSQSHRFAGHSIARKILYAE